MRLSCRSLPCIHKSYREIIHLHYVVFKFFCVFMVFCPYTPYFAFISLLLPRLKFEDASFCRHFLYVFSIIWEPEQCRLDLTCFSPLAPSLSNTRPSLLDNIQPCSSSLYSSLHGLGCCWQVGGWVAIGRRSVTWRVYNVGRQVDYIL